MSACRQIRPLLDELADGTLDDARSRAVRAHLRGCTGCAHDLREIETLTRAAADLRAVDPPASQWDVITARLDRLEAQTPAPPRVWWLWHAWRRQLLAGAGALAVCGAAAVFMTVRDRQPLEQTVAALPRPALSADEIYEAALREVARAENDYTGAIRDLREIVAVERGRWSPEIARAFDENLAAIDAIVARQADLARRTPGDPELADALHATYRRQIDFLQEAVVRGQLP